ncbi:protein mono-ADP-ribosyltransferase PARP12-like isoform X2 [Corvus kubaryi]|uniref:protein mono-ADP-ribosyltransferase PARP12-like isoform X2 n=1 Tax=Corvus kubaryi TaxID=68294 RepID=UPI001C047581|nr:protein mono-ADP-ribosyltransferase PARP12-like isoform X2 [Corvus kubaryi]XP_041901500.1 protein mono-ADP-ribosyltransferase PARP12-like isoform X2 [Corvus kubaryi]
MEYVWYWLDDSNQWIEYGKETWSKQMCSFKLKEELFDCLNSLKVDKMEAKIRLYHILSILHTGTKLRYLISGSRTDVHFLGGSLRTPMIPHRLIQLSYDSQEYGKIKRLFEKTMKNYCINQLQRIQNPTLWDIFQWQKEKMKKLNKLKGVDERLLFHGTSPSHVSAICEQNFDWRLCGAHGTMYGKGSYFARDASYSHEYCSSHRGCYSMFVAQVLVGDFVRGNPQYCRPPPRASNSNRLYDSCVDDLTDPSIFVIFEKQQIYPAYILEYSLNTSCVVL